MPESQLCWLARYVDENLWIGYANAQGEAVVRAPQPPLHARSLGAAAHRRRLCMELGLQGPLPPNASHAAAMGRGPRVQKAEAGARQRRVQDRGRCKAEAGAVRSEPRNTHRQPVLHSSPPSLLQA